MLSQMIACLAANFKFSKKVGKQNSYFSLLNLSSIGIVMTIYGSGHFFFVHWSATGNRACTLSSKPRSSGIISSRRVRLCADMHAELRPQAALWAHCCNHNLLAAKFTCRCTQVQTHVYLDINKNGIIPAYFSPRIQMPSVIIFPW